MFPVFLISAEKIGLQIALCLLTGIFQLKDQLFCSFLGFIFLEVSYVKPSLHFRLLYPIISLSIHIKTSKLGWYHIIKTNKMVPQILIRGESVRFSQGILIFVEQFIFFS